MLSRQLARSIAAGVAVRSSARPWLTPPPPSGTDPDRVSFTIALHTARDQLIHAACIIADTVIDPIETIGRHVLASLLPALAAAGQPPHRQTRHLHIPGPRP